MIDDRVLLVHLPYMPATSSKKPKYRRIVLKISGEALRNDTTGQAIDSDVLDRLAEELKSLRSIGTQVALVVGGGNIFRGLAGARSNGTDRTTGDNMGMLATVINGLALMDRLEKSGLEVRVMTAIAMDRIAEPLFNVAPLATLSAVALSFSSLALVILTAPPTTLPLCEPMKSGLMPSLKPPRSMEFTTKTR